MKAAVRGNTTTAHRRGRPDLSHIAGPLDQLRPDPSLRRWEQHVGKKAVKAM
jgi:hypothetical protein